MKHIILSSYKTESDSEMATSTYRIVGKMENNPVFTDAPPELAEAKVLAPLYHNLVWNAKGRDAEVISQKNDTKAKLVVLLTVLAAYVTRVCNGDRTKLLSSGFPISGERGEQPMADIPTLNVELGKAGKATTRIKRVAGAKAYMHQYVTEMPTGESIWNSEASTYAYYTFNTLKSGAQYWFRVVAIGSAGQIEYSPIESCYIQ